MTTLSRRALLALLLLPFAAARAQDTFENVERIVAVGDVHGDFDRLVELLRTAKVIDAKNAWNGGNTHLVLIGDFLDRGRDSRKVMDLLIDLQPQAREAGGWVHAIIGNHEAMNVYGDLRFVSRDEFDSYRTPESEALREKLYETVLNEERAKGGPSEGVGAFREKFLAAYPLGYVERRLAFLPSGKYGKWLGQQNAVVRINEYLFVHGGISPKYASMSRTEINERVRAELTDFAKLPGGLCTDPNGPLWYRGLAELPENEEGLAAHVARVLAKHQARHIVIGHTTTPVILPRFGGRVIMIDVGLSAIFRGTPAVMLVESGRAYNVYRNGRVDLPLERKGLAQYLREAQRLDPSNSRLRELARRAGRT